MLNVLFKWLLSVLLLPLVAAFVVEACFFLPNHIPWADASEAVIGFGGYILLYPVLLGFFGTNLDFLETFEHELGHAVTLAVMGHTFLRFHVNSYLTGENSRVSPAQPSNIDFIPRLAPYYLPVFTIPLVVIRLYIADWLLPWIDMAIGFSWGFHILGLLHEFRSEQDDLQKHTHFFALLITCLFNLVIMVGILAVIVEDYLLFVEYIEWSATRAADYYEWAFTSLRTQFLVTP